ncbi:hypothetical protein K504DRAFT_190563 [Pleomassaria siparia CBS 279.74]|uniref:Secreted protein n=1 Tax=Pleomassaria siparia CBS 279.74 TaxID=1314801 RepID=A0A6G1JQL0_9PLEO|nr:hypothetical protein K504DRAFT_190563 [Pleomassaria siparia CBS 279.74]
MPSQNWPLTYLPTLLLSLIFELSLELQPLFTRRPAGIYRLASGIAGAPMNSDCCMFCLFCLHFSSMVNQEAWKIRGAQLAKTVVATWLADERVNCFLLLHLFQQQAKSTHRARRLQHPHRRSILLLLRPIHPKQNIPRRHISVRC